MVISAGTSVQNAEKWIERYAISLASVASETGRHWEASAIDHTATTRSKCLSEEAQPLTPPWFSWKK
jgi:hypothetical protein